MNFTAKDARKLIGKDDATILEIGSNDGTDTQRFLHTFPAGQIHCFECEPRAIAKWTIKITDPRATLYEAALADVVGARTFHQSRGTPPGKVWEGYGDQWDMSGSLLPNDKHTEHSPWLKFDQTITVQCTTLDNWAVQFLAPEQIVDFAWVDVQGAEHLVLKGGQQTIKRVRWWYCEIDPRPNYHAQASLDDIRALLPGFELVREYSGYNYLWRNSSL